MKQACAHAIFCLAILGPFCVRAFALDPKLDVTQYAHTAWRIREGFTKGTINAIAQTPDGYLWLGTEFGLLRFDGVRNLAWQPPANQHLPSEVIASLLAARDGTLWIGTSRGLASWKDGKLVQYPKLAGVLVHRLLEDHEGTVWAGGISVPPPGKLCAIYDGSVHCSGADGSLGPAVLGLFEDRNNNLWVGVANGLWRWKPGNPEFYSLPDNPNGIEAFAENDDGALLIATGVGVRRLVAGKLEQLPIPAAAQQFEPLTMLRDRDGGLWIGTLQGLLHMHRGKTELVTQADGLSDNAISALLEDREGNVWVATASGLDRFRQFAVTTLSKNQGLSSSVVSSVLADRNGGSVWLSTWDGLNRWDQGHISISGKHGKLDGAHPTSLFQDSHGQIWISTAHGFGYLDRDRFVRVSGVPGGDMPSIAEDSAGNLWIANKDQGLIRVSPRSEVQQIPWAGLGHKDNALALVADPSRGGLWIGFLEGGIVYLAEGGLQASYSPPGGSGAVNDLRIDREGALWASTEGGLSRLKDGRVTVLTSKNGLPCDTVHWMTEDSDHSLWLLMSCGLVRIARSELNAWTSATDKDPNAKPVLQATVFDSADGVRAKSYAIGYTPHVATSSDGKLWFSGLEGVNVVDPQHLPFNKLPPPVHIEQIIADHKSYDVTADKNGQVRLPPLIRDLQIDYTALSVVVPEKVLFRYKLEGWDRDWQDVGTRRQAFYNNLPPRNYRFRVMACNNSGVWNEAGAFLDFSIAPAYYQTWWFRSLCVLAFLAMVYGAYRVRVGQLRAQEQKFREAIESIPAMAFISQPDGYRTFVNKGWVEYTGMTVEESLGSGWHAVIHQEDLKRVLGEWEAALASGKAMYYEARYRRAEDGQYRWFMVRVVPQHNKRGKIVKWFGTLTDIEDRKRAEESLRSSEAYLVEAQSLTQTGSCAIDGTSHETVYWSDEMFRLFAFDPQQGPPMFDQWLERIHPEDREKVKLANEGTFLNKVSCDLEFRIVKPDGGVKHIHGVGHPVLSPTGELVQVVGTMVDITERKRAEEAREKLRQLEADLAHINRVSTLGEMAASLAHEIKQPIAATITSANSCLEWLAHEPPNLDRARAAVARIDKYGNRAAEIIDRIRSFYKKSASQRELVDVNGIIEEILALLKCEADRYSVAMRTELAAELPKITADRVQLQQVFMNLILNAIQAMTDSGGEVIVRSQRQDSQVLFSVSDTGVGLPKEKMDQIFSAFFTTKPQGSGMGLSISRSIVESQGGRLWASANDGPGATFHFSLPVATHIVKETVTRT